jgi:hypothetical protein
MEILPQKKLFIPFIHKRYYEVNNDTVRIFGKCEVTNQDFEMFVSSDEFYRYLQDIHLIGSALPSVAKEEREFILSGTSPDGWIELWK